MIGVATADIRNRAGKYDSPNSLCVDDGGTLFVEGKIRKHYF